jgi:hypothetical protein
MKFVNDCFICGNTAVILIQKANVARMEEAYMIDRNTGKCVCSDCIEKVDMNGYFDVVFKE